MVDHIEIYAVSGGSALIVLALWGALSHALDRSIRSRLRAVPLCLPLLAMAVGYGLYWWAFFASPSLAVQMHAIRLMLAHFIGPFLPWIVTGWLAFALVALRPLVRHRR